MRNLLIILLLFVVGCIGPQPYMGEDGRFHTGTWKEAGEKGRNLEYLTVKRYESLSDKDKTYCKTMDGITVWDKEIQANVTCYSCLFPYDCDYCKSALYQKEQQAIWDRINAEDYRNSYEYNQLMRAIWDLERAMRD